MIESHFFRGACVSALIPACAVIVFVLLSGCGGVKNADPATAKITMAIGGQAELIYLPATMARELGYYRDEGLDVTIQDFPGGAKALESLLGGSADVVCGFYDHTVQLAAQGREVRAFVSLLRYPGLVAIAAAPSIRGIEDLRGRTVGVSAPGSATHFFLNYLLVKNGLKPGDVSTVSIGMSATAVSSVTHGKVDAAIMTDPALQIASKARPGLRILADTRTAEGVRSVFGVDTYASAVLYSTAPWLTSHSETAQRLARAMIKTLEWMRTHSAEEIRNRMPPQFRTEDEPTDVEAMRIAQAMLSTDGRLTPESTEAVRRVLSLSLDQVRDAHIDLAKTYTNEFVGP
jgi:NitT/TauT family transport system substrate-binding protein